MAIHLGMGAGSCGCGETNKESKHSTSWWVGSFPNWVKAPNLRNVLLFPIP